MPHFPINIAGYTDQELIEMREAITRILKERRKQRPSKKSK